MISEPRRSHGPGITAASVVTLLGVLLLAGCGYHVGSMHSPQYRTIYVPMAENLSYWRGLEYRLTEAVVKQIEQQTPYRVADADEADTVLSMRILDWEQRVITENSNDDPRALNVALYVQIIWQDLRTGQVLSSARVAVPTTTLVGSTDYHPELGQSFATASQDVITIMARDIVNMMEEPWAEAPHLPVPRRAER